MTDHFVTTTSPDGSLQAIGDNKGNLRFIETSNNEELRKLKYPSQIFALSFHPTRYLLAIAFINSVCVTDLRELENNSHSTFFMINIPFDNDNIMLDWIDDTLKYTSNLNQSQIIDPHINDNYKI